MNVAVLKYQFVTDKPLNIPDAWPAEVRELGTGTELPSEDWVLMTIEEYNTYLADNQAAYDTWESGVIAMNAYSSEAVSKKILNAMDFGKSVMVAYAVQNVLSQFSLEQIKDIITRTAKVQQALNTGSLYVALDELALIQTDETVITEAKITEVRNKIQDYLNIPRT